MRNMVFAALAALIVTFTAPQANAKEYTGQIVTRNGEQTMAVVFKKNDCVTCLHQRHKWGRLYDENAGAFVKEVARLNPGIVFTNIPVGATVYFPVPKGMGEQIASQSAFAASLQTLIEGLRETVEALTKKVEELAAALAGEQKKNAELTAYAAEKTSESQRRGVRIQVLEGQNAELREENGRLKDEKRQLVESYDNLKKETGSTAVPRGATVTLPQ